MVSLFFCAIAGLYMFHVGRDLYVLVNSVVGIITLAFELLLTLCILFSDVQTARPKHCFAKVIITAFLSTMCSVYTNEAGGLAEYSTWIYAAETFAYFFCRRVLVVPLAVYSQCFR